LGHGSWWVHPRWHDRKFPSCEPVSLRCLRVTQVPPCHDSLPQINHLAFPRNTIPYQGSIATKYILHNNSHKPSESNLQPSRLGRAGDEAVDDDHALRRCRRRQLRSWTLPKEDGRGQAHLDPAEVDAETLPRPVPKGIERQLCPLRELRPGQPAGVVEAENRQWQ